MHDPSSGQSKRYSFWRLHRFSYLALALLVFASLTLNLPLYSWAYAANTGSSGMWDGWPRRWYYVVVEDRHLIIKEIETDPLFFNATLLTLLFFASSIAIESLFRELPQTRFIKTSFMLAIISALCTFFALQSHNASSQFHDIVFTLQEFALFTVYNFVFVCWFAFFRVFCRLLSDKLACLPKPKP